MGSTDWDGNPVNTDTTLWDVDPVTTDTAPPANEDTAQPDWGQSWKRSSSQPRTSKPTIFARTTRKFSSVLVFKAL